MGTFLPRKLHENNIKSFFCCFCCFSFAQNTWNRYRSFSNKICNENNNFSGFVPFLVLILYSFNHSHKVFFWVKEILFLKDKAKKENRKTAWKNNKTKQNSTQTKSFIVWKLNFVWKKYVNGWPIQYEEIVYQQRV